MRKEIYGIILFFMVIFTLISLLSYSPGDPSINNARAAGQIHNLFGVVGAHVSGLLIGLFGLGAFWIPILLLLARMGIGRLVAVELSGFRFSCCWQVFNFSATIPAAP